MNDPIRGRLTSNLNLNGHSSPRAQPGVGDWGPQHVPSTRHKKWMRVLAWVMWLVALLAVLAFGTWVYMEMKRVGAA